MDRACRIASIFVAASGRAGEARIGRLAASLLAASPRVSVADPEICRLDARGWERLGGEPALVRFIRSIAVEGGVPGARIGVADGVIAADVAARSAGPEGRIVAVGGDVGFLAGQPVALLPVSDELKRTLRALGIDRIGEVAAREQAELEARLGPEGVKAHRLARGKGGPTFRPMRSESLPGAAFGLEGPATSLQPLLFVLRHLLARVLSELSEEGRCAAELELEIELEGGRRAATRISPARPTNREDLLFDLCRAVLERKFTGRRLEAPITSLVLRIGRKAAAETRQGDLFARRWRDPLAAAATLSRLRARLREDAVVRPAPRANHRPESRNRWRAVRIVAAGEGGRTGRSELPSVPPVEEETGDTVSAVLRLLPRPLAIRVMTTNGRPFALWDDIGRHDVLAAEGPERLSGDWWGSPYRREYYRLGTTGGELLWVFREQRPGEEDRWRLHGWWD